MSHQICHGLPSTPEESDQFRSDSILGPVDRDSYAIHKHRKTASTGGGRAWTEEEESYLLRTRSNKMPYKHIAAHLNKTELACRLHYHQMSYGSNRRKRTGSVSSTCSSSSFGSSFNPLSTLRETTPERSAFRHLTPVASPPSSPEALPTGLTPMHAASPGMAQRPILPKPIMTSVRPTLPSSSELSKALHLDTTFSQHRDFVRRSSIDVGRLRAVYAAHRDAFWGQIASQYSVTEKFSPAELEDAFMSAQSGLTRRHASSPPTPEPSPQAAGLSTFGGFSAINSSQKVENVTAQSPTERCAVSDLLN